MIGASPAAVRPRVDAPLIAVIRHAPVSMKRGLSRAKTSPSIIVGLQLKFDLLARP